MKIKDMWIARQMNKQRRKMGLGIVLSLGLLVLIDIAVSYMFITKVAAVFWGLSLIALLSIPLGLIAHSKLASAYPCKKTLSGFSPEELEKIDKECRDYFSLFDGGCCLLIPTTYVLFVPVNFELAAVPMDKIFNVQITPSKRQRGRYQSIYVWPQLPTYFDIEVMANKEGKIKVRTDGFAPLEFKGRMMDIRPEAEIHIEDYEGLNE